MLASDDNRGTEDFSEGSQAVVSDKGCAIDSDSYVDESEKWKAYDRNHVFTSRVSGYQSIQSIQTTQNGATMNQVARSKVLLRFAAPSCYFYRLAHLIENIDLFCSLKFKTDCPLHLFSSF